MFSRKRDRSDDGHQCGPDCGHDDYEPAFSDAATVDDSGADFGEIEIFAKGRHRAMNGQGYVFTDTHLAEMVEGFNPLTHPVPVVIGHPTHDAPAYAWVKDLRVDGDKIKAILRHVESAFAELVKAGRYKQISIKAYAPDAETNPNPGQYTLRHVGFLGAAAPAVKGLKPVEFAEDEGACIAFDEGDTHGYPAEFTRRLRRMENETMIDKLTREGTFLPGHRDKVLEFMNALDADEAITFADGRVESPLDFFRDYLGTQVQVVPMGEVVAFTQEPDQVKPSDFVAPKGHHVDQDALDMHAKAHQVMREKGVSFAEAVDMVSTQ